ncbi:MAG: sensor histidine kinase [Polyangiales bacterium]
MSVSDKDERLPRKPAHSGVHALQIKTATFPEKLLRLGASAGPDVDVADLIDLYFEFFRELDADGFWAIHLLSEHDIALQRTSSRVPATATLSVTRQAWVEAGLSDENTHPSVQLVDLYQPVQRGGFQAVLVAGRRALGVISHEASEPDEGRETEVRLIAATLAPRIERTHHRPTHTPLGDYVTALMRRADVPLVLVDGAGCVLVASQGFCHLIGRASVNSKPWSEFIAPRDWPHVEQATRNGTAVECDLVGAASTLRVGLEFLPLAHPALRGAGALVICRDLRTLRNLEQQVIHAEKLATLGQLAAGVVHELNNPLTSILAYSEHMHSIAAKKSRPVKEVEALARIVESSLRMKRFTQSLVSYARPAQGHATRVNVGGLIDESLGFCEHLIRDVDTRVQLDLPEDFPGARGVRASLQQVLINLITNACHATASDGQIRIIAALEGDDVTIRVIDNGPGVPNALHEEIFEPFFSTKREGDGTGLGLSIVRNILSLQSGSIELDASYKDGACFVVRLPIWR